MAAALRFPLRLYEPVEAACAHAYARIHAGGVEVSTVTKFWPDATACKARATVVVFVLRSVSSRRERCQRRSEARAATFHARRRAELAVADAQSAACKKRQKRNGHNKN